MNDGITLPIEKAVEGGGKAVLATAWRPKDQVEGMSASSPGETEAEACVHQQLSCTVL